MISEVRIAASHRAGRTVLQRLDAHGALAIRQTGPAEVCLIGIAAGPLDGDAIRIHVEVGAGARLQITSAAAMIALPGTAQTEPSRLTTEILVGADAQLGWQPEPLVVARGAHVETRTQVELADASVALDFQDVVVIGRYDEEARWQGDSAWRAHTKVTRAGSEVLVASQDGRILDTSGAWRGFRERVVHTSIQCQPGLVPEFAPETDGEFLRSWHAGMTITTGISAEAGHLPQRMGIGGQPVDVYAHRSAKPVVQGSNGTV